MTKNKISILGIDISNLSKVEILEEIRKWFESERGFYQIVTVNPEFLVLAQKDKRFKNALNNAKIATPDGIGVLLAGKILGRPFKERVTGVTLMKGMVKMANEYRLTVGLIGGSGNVALRTAECLKNQWPSLKFFALEGPKNIKNQSSDEWVKSISIIAARKPQILFVAFGAPWQEFFIDSLKKDLQTTNNELPIIVAMGVGGAFDEISGQVKEVPRWLDRIGFKWLWRLFYQPWRWRRQLALIEFMWLVLKENYRKRTRDHHMTF